MTVFAEREGKPFSPHLAHAVETAESLCIKCGFCLPACPTYRETGAEAASPRGRLDLMYAAARGALDIREISHPLWFCVGCLACESACPSAIRFRDLLEAGRADDREASGATGFGGWGRRLLLNRVLLSPRLLRLLAWTLYLFRCTGLRIFLGGHGLLAVLAPRLARLERRTPPIDLPRNWRAAAKPWLADENTGDSPPVAMLTGCVMDAIFGRVHAATAKVLHVNGYAVHLPREQTCCGALHLHGGEPEEARALARRNIEAFEALGDAPVVVDSAACAGAMKEYRQLFAGDEEWEGRARRFGARVKDVCEFLAGSGMREPPRPLSLRVAYDDPCHLLHGQKIGQPPRAVLSRIPGLELVPLPESEWCCGGAGSYSLTQPEMSRRILNRKMERLGACGAEVVATGNPGCLLQLRLGVRQARLRVRVAHPVELLAEAYD